MFSLRFKVFAKLHVCRMTATLITGNPSAKARRWARFAPHPHELFHHLLFLLYGLLVPIQNYFLKLQIISIIGRTPWTGDQPNTERQKQLRHPRLKR
jgi:hypothetical protein